jgi:hypothetical protein
MIFAQTAKFRFASSPITILLFLGIGVCLCEAQEAMEQNSALGELKLQGKYINYLVLRRKDGRTERFNRPEETIKLPAGEYRLQEVRLEGGYTCRLLSVSGRDWVTVDEDKPAVFKVGAPFKQTVRVQRQGGILVLNYELLGVGGEKYTGGDRSKPPTFSVYKRDKEIASDKFEFG